MSIDRTTIAKGPGLITLGAVPFHDKDGIQSELQTESNRPPSSQFGELKPRVADQIGKTTFTPVGLVTAAIIAKLFPAAYQTPVNGASIFGSSDELCTVHSKAGVKVPWHNSALTTMPEIYLSAMKTAFGSAEITHLLKNDTERSAANSLVGPVATETFADSGFSESDIKMVQYTGAWGSTLTGIQAKDGWTITPELQLRAEKSDDDGTYDFTLELVKISAKCRPLGLDEADILDNLPTEQSIGSIPANAADLTITGVGGLTVVLKGATLLQGPLHYDNQDLRAGEILFEASSDVTGGGALFTIALT